MTPSKRRPKRRYRRSGAYAIQRSLQELGLSALDGSPLAAPARAWAEEIETALGEELSPQQREIVEHAACGKVVLAIIDTALARDPSWVVNHRNRKLTQLALDRFKVARDVREALAAVGLKRVPKKTPSLAEYLAARTTPAHAESTPTAEADRPGPSTIVDPGAGDAA